MRLLLSPTLQIQAVIDHPLEARLGWGGNGIPFAGVEIAPEFFVRAAGLVPAPAAAAKNERDQEGSHGEAYTA